MKEKLVYPGSFLSIGEEFLPGKNAFENSEGDIYSSCIGEPNFDNEQRVVSVQTPKHTAKLIDSGTIVFGKIEMMRESMLFVKVLYAENQGEVRKNSSTSVVLPIFNVENRFVESLSDLFRVGDIIKARVVSVSPFNIELETKSSPSLGVVKGFCTECRSMLRRHHHGFKCPKCAAAAMRKFSDDYFVK